MLAIKNLIRPLLILLLTLAIAPARPVVGTVPTMPPVIVSGLHYQGYEGTSDEAVKLTVIAGEPQVLDQWWGVRDSDGHTIYFTNAITVASQASIWLASDTAAFQRQFGFLPTLTYGSQLTFPNLAGGAQLISRTHRLLDSSNSTGGAWPAGSASPLYVSMERRDSTLADAPSNWGNAIATLPGVFDQKLNPINGTPRAQNSISYTPTTPTTLTVVINEVAWAGTVASSSHEWIELYNNADRDISLDGWQIEISSKSPIELTGTIKAHDYFLIAHNPATFYSGPTPDLVSSFILVNTGAALTLIDGHTTIVDAVKYGVPTLQTVGWLGDPVTPYTVSHLIVPDGQVLVRKMPLQDTNTAIDWISDRSDVIGGRRAAFPGWRLDEFAQSVRAQTHITVAVAPDASFEVIRALLEQSQSTVDIETYSFESAALADLLRSRILSGVQVRVLLDGTPVGGLPDQTRWACDRISSVPGSPNSGCWFMRSDDARNVHRRYDSFHAKFMIVDDAQLAVSSENLSPNGMPNDDKRDGTMGQRGFVAIMDAPGLIARAREIWNADLGYPDMVRFGLENPWTAPTAGFVPVTITGGTGYSAQFVKPLVVSSLVSVELSTSPESNLSDRTGLIPLIQSLSDGDILLAEQLEEPAYWGPIDSDPLRDPNPRLAAVQAAARRGVHVSLLLDRFFARQTDVRGNFATATYLRSAESQTSSNFKVALGNPTGHGIHNKSWLIQKASHGYSEIGSWNGSEASAKTNREMAVLIESDLVFAYLQEVFGHDWRWSNPVSLPSVMNHYAGVADHVLVSEVLYDPIGLDDGREWIEIFNPTNSEIDLTGYKIGDAESPGRSSADGMFMFPAGTRLAAGANFVIAQNALLYTADYQRPPDFEIADYDPAVPNLAAYTPWSNGAISLNNAGDQVLLLGPSDKIIDSVQWGNSTALSSPIAFTRAISAGHSLQRWPPAADSQNTALDFRDQIAPSPGRVP